MHASTVMCPGVDVLLQQQKEGIEYHSTSPRYRDHKNISPDEHEIRDNLCACSMASLLSSSHAFGCLLHVVTLQLFNFSGQEELEFDTNDLENIEMIQVRTTSNV